MLNIVLLEPEIPANTGNIGRTCVAAGAKLHLIEPMGFQINEKQVKRAKIYMATTKATHVYSEVAYEEDCYIMFGKESAGIPEDILVENEETTVRIPMFGDIRSLNLGNSVAIVLYEALRQHQFQELNKEGHLHHSHWKDGTV